MANFMLYIFYPNKKKKKQNMRRGENRVFPETAAGGILIFLFITPPSV